ncbi:S8 family serine peptidase [Geotalea uraniireducens]|uniref:Peptidase S8 and S53, subtilisin, kexin, sedolisin n=1 Tax=Geotalea uraniireducens (strain Rf4) TaxID=351605 RepID=A5G5W4_GEOUR|nr:S8 family serine peptidase [Geotalea uraniireducens]ABQ27182.1 peptidase S8 and S53, subtilisin, kexin, sedolisin [Geotalea uraniireducens Rf4]
MGSLRGSKKFHMTVRVATFLAVLGVSVHASLAATDSYAINSRQQFIDRGKLHAGVKNRVEQTGEADIILVLNDIDVISMADRIKERLEIRNDSPEITAEKSRLFTNKKKQALTALSPAHYQLLQDYDQLPVMHLKVDAEALDALLQLDEVVLVNEDRAFVPHLSASLPLIGALEAHAAGATGSGTSVAVLDTGVNYTLAAFGSCTAPGIPAGCKVAYTQDFAADDGSLDDNGHGTNVSGIIVGVAPDTKIIGLDVFRTDGYAYDSDLLAALNWVLANRTTYNIAAVNMSLGGGKYTSGCPTDSLASAINNLKSAGVVSAISSGNDGYTNAISSPACIPAAVSVGAVYDANVGSRNWTVCSDLTTTADKVTCFSNSASFLTILAPGALISAANITMAGTSQASPHVSGAVALIRGQHASLTATEIVNKLSSTGVSVTYNSITKPRLNVAAALRFPQIATQPASVAFGYLLIGTGEPAQTFTITNTGALDLSVGTIALTGAVADFVMQSDYCSGQTLTPAASCSVSVKFSPQSAGFKTAALSIPSNDPDQPSLALPLSGTAGMSYTLTTAKAGSGTITSAPAGISCGGDCTELYPQGAAVTLTALPDPGWVFAGWSGSGCSNGPCVVTLNGDFSITALFSLLQPVKLSSVSGSGYPTIQSAYDAAAQVDAIQILAQTFTENIFLNRPVSVILTGGYDSTYTSPQGLTTINGTMTISDGTVTVANLVIL